MDLGTLTPAQQRAFADLLSPGDRPSFRPELADELRELVEDNVATVADRLLPAELRVSKSPLGQVHQCEQHYVARRAEPFSWSLPVVRGVIAHKAVEMAIHLPPEIPPSDVVTQTIDRMIEREDVSSWPREYLLNASSLELAELRSAATAWLTSFQECFPPLRASWRPRLETSLRAELCGGRIVLTAKPDLALGRALGHQARVLVIDFKTGAPYPGHLDDLRFYALVETLRQGVPPFRVATYYLHAARWHAEDVTEDTLHSAARRLVGGITKMADLIHGLRSPSITPGPSCWYCPLRETCDGARHWEEQRESLGVDSP